MRPGEAEDDERPVQQLARPASRITSRGPWDQMSQTLVGQHAGVSQRLFGDVVPEVLAAQPAERRVGFQVRVGSPRRRRPRIRSRTQPAGSSTGPRRSSRAPAPAVRRAGASRSSGDRRRPEVGADEEHLAAAGRDRHEAVERDRVADRPGGEHEHSAPAARSTASRVARRSEPRGERLPQQPDQRQRARRAAGTPAGPARAARTNPDPSQAQGIARKAGRRRRPERSAARTPGGEQQSPPAARSSASPGTRAGPGRWPPRRPRSGRRRARRAAGRSGR